MKIAYYHAGSGNRGCEAIVLTLHKLLNIDHLYSFQAKEDTHIPIKTIRQSFWGKLVDLDPQYQNDIAFSIGGDNYCDFGNQLAMYNKRFNETGCKTALIGCSIDDRIFENPKAIEDLKRFSFITARETITHENLKQRGIEASLIPDSAFILETKEVVLEGDYIGINGSNIIDNEMSYNNYVNLIKHILENTNYKVLLIPHVVQKYNNDMVFLNRLKEEINNERVELLEETDCIALKGYISKCKMLICSRTHCSIAGYSSNVPTLVIGYSTKSKGIAKDIFGTYENYVVPYTDLKSENDLIDSFKWLSSNQKKIRKHLEEFMPSYKEKVYQLKELIK